MNWLAIPGAMLTYLLVCPLNCQEWKDSTPYVDYYSASACVEGSGDEGRRQATYNKLKLLDTALHLECPTYQGPYLPRNLTAKRLYCGHRLTRIRGRVYKHLSSFLGGIDLCQQQVVLPKLPLNDLYIVDLMINLNKAGKALPNTTAAGIHKRVAVLLLLPEHFCQGSILIGPQAMRVRHLTLLGHTVVVLDVFQLEQLDQRGHKETFEYLQNKLGPVICLDKHPSLQGQGPSADC